MKKLITICAVAAMMVFATSVAYALPSDNFDNNSIDTTLWTLYEDDPDNAWLDETNQQLEIRSTGAGGGEAFYFANDWGLLPTGDFSFKADFHRSSISMPMWSMFSTTFGLGKGDDPETIKNNNVTIEALKTHEVGYFSFFQCTKTTDGNTVLVIPAAPSQDDGTAYISYDANEDELYLSDTGYWAADAWVAIPDLLQDEWEGAVVRPFLGGWASGVVLASGEAYLDNFVVDSGTFVPEPATIVLLGFGSLALLRRKTKA